MNIFSFTGNLGRDCNVRQAGESTVCGFPVAVTSGYGDKEKTTWVVCEMWGKRAEGKLPEYLTKGQKVAVSGELSLDEYQDKEGANKSAIKVRVNSLDLVGDKKPKQDSEAKSNDDSEADIPF